LRPLAAITGFHVIAFDLPGAGKSEGALSASCDTVIKHIDAIINWAVLNVGTSEVVLWARGMSTAAAVEYTSSTVSKGVYAKLIKFLVLDSPYASVKTVIDSVILKYREKNTFSVVVPLFGACSFMFGREITAKLGADIYAVKPIIFANKNKTPCLILSASRDDYIPASHAEQFYEEWVGPCFLKVIDGDHYSARSEDSVLLAVELLRSFFTF
jgi:alpha-beta hydrolase superfamily lysophospholipase